MFSRFSKGLKNVDAVTLPEMKNIISESYTPVPEMYDVVEVGDFKNWFPADDFKELVLTNCAAFEFKLVDAAVRLRAKAWPTDADWEPEQGHVILSDGDNVRVTIWQIIDQSIACIPSLLRHGQFLLESWRLPWFL